MLPPLALTGLRGLVTGASRGIGAAVARALAEAGADVAVTSRSVDASQGTADAIRAAGRRSLALPLEVRDLASIDECFARIDEAWGGIDVLVNNAGTNAPRGIFEVREPDWDLVLDTDLKGLFFVTQAAATRMVRAGRGGRVVNIASQLGLVGRPNRSSYAAAKGGVVNLTRAMAIELAPYRITVNAIAPTLVRTELTESLLGDAAFESEMLSSIPLGRFATPDDVAAATVYLASPGASLVTGHTLVVDGGYTAR